MPRFSTVVSIAAIVLLLASVVVSCAVQAQDGVEALDQKQQAIVDSYKPPLSAIAVTCNGLAVSLFIQLDADHLFRADPRQSDIFTNVKGTMVASHAAPMEWKVAYALAQKAVLTTHVAVPCAEGSQI